MTKRFVQFIIISYAAMYIIQSLVIMDNVSKNMELTDIRYQIDIANRENNELKTQIAARSNISYVETQAKAMGLKPIKTISWTN